MPYPLLILLLGLSSSCLAQAKNHDLYSPCWYQAKSEKSLSKTAFEEHKNCAYYTSNKQLVINKNVFKNISFNKDKLAIINFAQQFYYINPFGQSAAVITYDNWADDFQEGLARIQIDNKIGYINKNLEIVISPQFDWAFPFKKGVATVCIECRKEPMGEHQMINGGLWGKIDRNGNRLVPLAPR